MKRSTRRNLASTKTKIYITSRPIQCRQTLASFATNPHKFTKPENGTSTEPSSYGLGVRRIMKMKHIGISALIGLAVGIISAVVLVSVSRATGLEIEPFWYGVAGAPSAVISVIYISSNIEKEKKS